MEHPWFGGVDWDALAVGAVTVPFVPQAPLTLTLTLTLTRTRTRTRTRTLTNPNPQPNPNQLMSEEDDSNFGPLQYRGKPIRGEHAYDKEVSSPFTLPLALALTRLSPEP